MRWWQGNEPWFLEGVFAGQLQIQGDLAGCQAVAGDLLAANARWLLPSLPLGQTRVHPACSGPWPLQVELQRPQQHQLQLQLDPQARRGHLRGEVEPSGELARMASAWGLIAPRQRQIDQPLSW